MKILYISNSYIPSEHANSMQVMKMTEALSDAGHEVVLLSQKGAAHSDIRCLYKINFKFTLKTLPYKSNIIKVIYYFIQLIKLKPDLVYCRTIYGCFASTLLGFKTYLEIHDDRWRRGKVGPRLYAFVNKTKNLVKIIAITQSLLREYKKDWPLSRCNSYIVLPDGASEVQFKTKIFNHRQKKGLEKITVGYVGGLYEGKGIEVIQKIAPMLKDVDFHIVGGNTQLLNYWKKNIPYKNVKFFGFIRQNEIHQYYAKMKICIIPNQHKSYSTGKKSVNISDFTSPLKMFEYMAYRKPIIASDLPVFQEILKNGHNALLVKPDDYVGWINAINTLKDFRIRKKLSDNAHHDFTLNYTWDKRVSKLFIDKLQ